MYLCLYIYIYVCVCVCVCGWVWVGGFQGSGFSVNGLGQVALVLAGPVVPSFRALSRRLKFTVRRHKFNKDSLSPAQTGCDKREPCPPAHG